MSRTKIIAIYSLIGPLIGALSLFSMFALPMMLRDIWDDPGNQFGHDRIDEAWKTLALTAIFGYVLGFFPALVSGIVHIKLLPYFRDHRFLCVGLVCLSGVLATGIEMMPFGILKGSELTFLIVPMGTALILSICLTKPCN